MNDPFVGFGDLVFQNDSVEIGLRRSLSLPESLMVTASGVKIRKNSMPSANVPAILAIMYANIWQALLGCSNIESFMAVIMADDIAKVITTTLKGIWSIQKQYPATSRSISVENEPNLRFEESFISEYFIIYAQRQKISQSIDSRSVK